MIVENKLKQYGIKGIFDEFDLIFEVLKGDLQSVSEYYKPNTPHEQFWRRSMLRSLFPNIEAFCFSVKQMSLKIANKNSIELSEKEMKNILEKESKLDNSGTLKEEKVKIGTVDNFKFSLKILYKVCGQTKLPIDYNSQEYLGFIRVKEIRDRITHPKSSTSLEISDNELKDIRLVQDWYFSIIEQSARTVIKMIEENRSHP